MSSGGLKVTKNVRTIFFVILIFIILGIFMKFSGYPSGITGMASSKPTNLTIGITGVNPAIVEWVSPIAATNALELGVVNLSFSVWMYDGDGSADLNDSSVTANFTNGSTAKVNSSCVWVNDFLTYRANYTCSIQMWYWDTAGGWIIGASGNDLGNRTRAHNTSTTFTYNELKAMVISPLSLTWPNISPGGTNQTSDTDPTTVNNTGNYKGIINMTALSLLGETDQNHVIGANNFTIGLKTDTWFPECGRGTTNVTALVNGTSTALSGSMSNPGNLSAGSGAGQEALYYCITNVPPVLLTQTYSTLYGGSWTILY